MTRTDGTEGVEIVRHLWESDHPYYCLASNYDAVDRSHHYPSWDSFLEARAFEDPDLNLLFRFDWIEEPADGTGSKPCGTLYLFFILQRIGCFSICTIDVARDDEPSIIPFLQRRYQRMLDVWHPFSTGMTETARLENDKRCEAERERDEMKAAWLSAERRVEEAVRGLRYLDDIDEFWAAYGYPNNSGALTIAEQASATLRELELARDEISRLKLAG